MREHAVILGVAANSLTRDGEVHTNPGLVGYVLRRIVGIAEEVAR